ncbi:hypothetical protein BDZ45DRAFT_681022 [Acephala macrosclerotiorum]|nr:hypothetical protein BDZ45DRAFT_681022 [Acephala macrosclerotiorum]
MAVQQRQASGVFARVQSLVDSYILSPQTRERYWNKAGTFAQEQPLLFTFVVAQLLFSFLPLALFASFVLGTLFLSLISALLFSLFWIGVALLVLVPTLFITVSLGFIFWVWAISSFLVSKWVYDRISVNVKGQTEVGLPNGKKFVVDKGEGLGDFKGEVKENGV